MRLQTSSTHRKVELPEKRLGRDREVHTCTRMYVFRSCLCVFAVTSPVTWCSSSSYSPFLILSSCPHPFPCQYRMKHNTDQARMGIWKDINTLQSRSSQVSSARSNPRTRRPSVLSPGTALHGKEDMLARSAERKCRLHCDQTVKATADLQELASKSNAARGHGTSQGKKMTRAQQGRGHSWVRAQNGENKTWRAQKASTADRSAEDHAPRRPHS